MWHKPDRMLGVIAESELHEIVATNGGAEDRVRSTGSGSKNILRAELPHALRAHCRWRGRDCGDARTRRLPAADRIGMAGSPRPAGTGGRKLGAQPGLRGALAHADGTLQEALGIQEKKAGRYALGTAPRQRSRTAPDAIHPGGTGGLCDQLSLAIAVSTGLAPPPTRRFWPTSVGTSI